MGHIPYETSVAKGLFNFLDPSQNGILGFEPDQLQAMIKCAFTEEKTYNFSILRQAALCVLQYWGTVRFIEIQEMQIGHLVCKGVYFELILFKSRGDKPKRREVTLINPTPTKYLVKFCPVAILSAYSSVINGLCAVSHSYFIFPKMSSSI